MPCVASWKPLAQVEMIHMHILRLSLDIGQEKVLKVNDIGGFELVKVDIEISEQEKQVL